MPRFTHGRVHSISISVRGKIVHHPSLPSRSSGAATLASRGLKGHFGRLSTAALAIVTAISLVMLIAGMIAAPAHAADRQELDHGHMDIFNVVSTDDGGIAMTLKEDVTGQHVQRSPEGVLLRVKDAAYKTFPAGFADQGLPTEGYWLPLTQDQSLLWPGWDTLDVSRNGFDAIDINFKEVKGPGEIFLFSEGSFGGLSSLLSDGGYTVRSGSTIDQKYPAHTHTNWIFTKPGTYTMKVQAEGEKNGKKYTTKTHTYTWLVGSEATAPKEQPAEDTETVETDGEENTGTTPADGDNHNHDGAHSNDGANSDNKDHDGDNAAATDANKCSADTVSADNKLGLAPAIRDDRKSPAKMISPNDVAFRLGSASKATTTTQVGAIGADTDVYMIGSTQVPNVPWLGANTMNESVLENSTGEVRWRLTGFEGPGDMEVFTSGNFGKVVGEKWFSATGGKPSGEITIPRNTHVHPNWIFTQAGTYKVTIEQVATLNDGTVVSAPTTLTFFVGDSTDAAGAKDVATEGHFDLGAQLLKGVSHSVWTNADGKPCQPGKGNGQGNGQGGDTNGNDSDSNNGGHSGHNHDHGNGNGNGHNNNGGKKPNSGNNSGSTSSSKGGSLASTGVGGLLIPLLIFAVGLVALGLSLVRFVQK